MGTVKKLYQDQLVGGSGSAGQEVYPVTSTLGVYDTDNNQLQGVLDKVTTNLGLFTCGTAAATAAKTVSASKFVLMEGGSVKIKFTYANSAASPTLAIGSTAAKPIMFNGSAASASNSWEAGEVVEFYYDGTNWVGRTTTPVTKEQLNQLGQRGYIFMGNLTPSINPATTGAGFKRFWVLSDPGDYSHLTSNIITLTGNETLIHIREANNTSSNIIVEVKPFKNILVPGDMDTHSFGYQMEKYAKYRYFDDSIKISVLENGLNKTDAATIVGIECNIPTAGASTVFQLVFRLNNDTYFKLNKAILCPYAAPFTLSSIPDGFVEHVVYFNALPNNYKYGYGVAKVSVNWHYLLEKLGGVTFSNAESLKARCSRVSQPALYPFKAGGRYDLNLFKGIRDIYIENRDTTKHYFLRCFLKQSTPPNDLQLYIGVGDTTTGTTLSNTTTIASIITSTTEVDVNKPILYEMTHATYGKICVLVCWKELIDSGISIWQGTSGTSINPFSRADDIDFDWDAIARSNQISDILAIKAKLDQADIEAGTGIEVTYSGRKVVISNSQQGLEDNSVTTAKIVDGAVTTPKLASSSVTAEKLATGAVTSEKIAAKAVDENKFANSVIPYIASQIGSTITNFPDNITLKSENGVLSLKDIDGTETTLAHIVISEPLTIVSANGFATNLFAKWANAIVEIKAPITVDLGSWVEVQRDKKYIWWFNGGSMSFTENSKSIYSSGNIYIVAEPYQIFYNLKFGANSGYSPYLIADKAYGEWFGAKPDGVTFSAGAFNQLCNTIKCNYIQLCRGFAGTSNAAYLLEATAKFNVPVKGGAGCKLSRAHTWFDILITTAINPTSSQLQFSVDTEDENYANLQVGQGICIMPATGTVTSGSQMDYSDRKIVAINNGVITCSTSCNKTYAANTMRMANNYILITLTENASLEDVVIEGGREYVPYGRTHWEVAECVSSNATNAYVKNCVINNSVGDAIVTFGLDCLVEHNIIQHCGSNGLHFSGCNTVIVKDNYIFDTNLNPLTGHNEGAITYSNAVQNIFIDNNVFDTCLAGIGGIYSADDCKSEISNNVFLNFRTHGIEGECGRASSYTTATDFIRDFIIVNNRFYATKDELMSWELPYQRTPVGSQTDAMGYGVYLKGNTQGGWNNILMSNNVFRDCGVYVGNCVVGIVANNIFNSVHTFDATHPSDIIHYEDSNMNMTGNMFKVTTPSITKLVVVSGGKVNIANTMYSASVGLVDSSANVNESNNISY